MSQLEEELKKSVLKILQDSSTPLNIDMVHEVLQNEWDVTRLETEHTLQSLLAAGQVSYRAALPSGKWSIGRKIEIRIRSDRVLGWKGQRSLEASL